MLAVVCCGMYYCLGYHVARQCDVGVMYLSMYCNVVHCESQCVMLSDAMCCSM